MTGPAGEPDGTVLVLTGPVDPTADVVVTELTRRGVPVFRFDPADFPDRVTVTATFAGGWSGTIATARRRLAIGDIRSAYLRRPGPAGVGAGVAEADREWAGAEARGGLGGLVAAVPRWLNHPDRMDHAEYKPVQLAAAAAAGLDTPRTLVTNDPAAARRFVAELPRAVYKAFCSTVRGASGRRFIYTSPVGPDDLAGGSGEGIRHTAHLFQEWIDKAYEVRLTVVDDRFFAARLTGRSPAARVDWRSDYPAVGYGVAEVPDRVRRAVAALLRGLDLRFAAMDFAVRPDGSWVFLDLNPNGQWGWIEHETGLPIRDAICDALQYGPPPA